MMAYEFFVPLRNPLFEIDGVKYSLHFGSAGLGLDFKKGIAWERTWVLISALQLAMEVQVKGLATLKLYSCEMVT